MNYIFIGRNNDPRYFSRFHGRSYFIPCRPLAQSGILQRSRLYSGRAPARPHINGGIRLGLCSRRHDVRPSDLRRVLIIRQVVAEGCSDCSGAGWDSKYLPYFRVQAINMLWSVQCFMPIFLTFNLLPTDTANPFPPFLWYRPVPSAQ
jgi:hypothetical protein